MVGFTNLILICSVFILIEANHTRIVKRNVLLSRKKRYLVFPKGSNFAITMSYVKGVMQVQPTGWNVLGECDVPFALPSDTRFYKKPFNRRHYIERREVYAQLETALSQGGLNGEACVQRMMCEAQQYRAFKGKSLVRDLLHTIFTSSELGLDENFDCSKASELDCSLNILDYIYKSMVY